MDFDTQVKLAVYRHFADEARRPSVTQLVTILGSTAGDIRASFARLFAKRVLVLEPDGESIRMAPPFSGIPTQHRVNVAGREYFANCAWDTLGIIAALRHSGTIFSRCGQSAEPLAFETGTATPPRTEWLFHCAVPAVHWWKDIVFT